MPHVYLGVHLPFKPYHKIKLENFDLESTAAVLRAEAAKLIKADVSSEDFDFIYSGDLLQAEDVLQNKGIMNGAMIHVIVRWRETGTPNAGKTFTEADVQEVLGIWRTVDSSNFQKVRQPEFMKNVLDAHPAIRKDLWVLSILKDPILLSSMQQPETIRRVAEKHHILIEASRSIVQLLNSKMISKLSTLAAPIESTLDDPLSDSSSSDENTSPTSSNRTLRRITADQLASALAFAGSSSFNSLSNISQRDADNRESNEQTNQPSTSTTTATSGASRNTRIRSSMFMDVLTAMRQRRQQPTSSDSVAIATDNATEPELMDTSPPSLPPPPPVPPEAAVNVPMVTDSNDIGAQTQSQHSTLAASIGQYRAELEQMREMGLTDTETNLQALIVCNGNVESAINLVFGGMNN